jgi:hypothetical protein
MSFLRSSKLENWHKKWAHSELDKAYFFADSMESVDGKIGYYIQDDTTNTILFSLYDYEYDWDSSLSEDDGMIEAEVERYEEYLMNKYKNYTEVISKIRKEENENLYKEEKKFSRSVSF